MPSFRRPRGQRISDHEKEANIIRGILQVPRTKWTLVPTGKGVRLVEGDADKFVNQRRKSDWKRAVGKSRRHLGVQHICGRNTGLSPNGHQVLQS